jgi:hypothetical protein
MKKTYPLRVEGKHPDRVLDAVKNEIRKYFKRERSRPLPKGVPFWDFDCQVGLSADTAQPLKPGQVVSTVGTLAQDGASSVYVEILCKHGVWVPPPAGSASPSAASSGDDSQGPD